MKTIDWEKVVARLRGESNTAHKVAEDAAGDGDKLAAAMMATISGVHHGLANAIEAGLVDAQ